MSFTRRMTAAVVTPLLLTASMTGCDASSDAGPNGDVVVAADLELSGAGAAAGAAYERALQLKVEQINASGALGKRTLTLRVLDNRSDPTASLRNINTFADDPKVAAIIDGSCSECVVGAAKTINDRRIPTISLAAADEVGTPIANRRFVFKLAPNAVDSAAALTAELKRTGSTRVALLTADNLYGHDGQRAMRSALNKAGITVTRTMTVAPTANDISQAVRMAVDKQPDALLVWTTADQATLAATSARRDKFTGRLYFDAAAAGELFVPHDAAAATNNAAMVFTQIMAIDDVIATTPAKAARKQWFRDYTSRYGSYSGVGAFAADAVELIAEAVGKVGVDRNRIREVLETSQTDGLTGPIRFTPDNHSGLMPQALTMLAVRSGRWRLLS